MNIQGQEVKLSFGVQLMSVSCYCNCPLFPKLAGKFSTSIFDDALVGIFVQIPANKKFSQKVIIILFIVLTFCM